LDRRDDDALKLIDYGNQIGFEDTYSVKGKSDMTHTYMAPEVLNRGKSN